MLNYQPTQLDHFICRALRLQLRCSNIAISKQSNGRLYHVPNSSRVIIKDDLLLSFLCGSTFDDESLPIK